jgi:hypothetical protein
MKVIDGWVKRESSPVKNKSACQEETGIGCNSLSESECMASKERLRSKVETGFLIRKDFLPGNGWVVDPTTGGYVLVTSRKFSKNPGIRSWHIR